MTRRGPERLWMAIAIATWWLLSVGGEAEADEQLDIKEPSVPGAVRRRGKRWRIVGIFQHGWSLIIAALINNQLLPVKPGRPKHGPGCPIAMRNPLLLGWWKVRSEKTYTCKPPPGRVRRWPRRAEFHPG